MSKVSLSLNVEEKHIRPMITLLVSRVVVKYFTSSKGGLT